MSKSILVVEDEIIVAKDISETLVSCGFRISGIANNAMSAMQLFKSRIPDLILCDINLGKGKTGIDFVREAMKIQRVPVVFVTAYSDDNTVNEAFDTIPDAYLTKPFTNEQLCITVNRVLRKAKGYLKTDPDIPKPTKREMEIIRMIAKGHSSKQISRDLSISFETVQSHRKNLFQKYNINSSAELISLAHKHGWLS
jgi:DNA-binding NarL/FixJ family response regulator